MRCKHNLSDGQCTNVALAGTDKCRKHTRVKVDNYLLTNPELQTSVARMDNSTLKSLRDEIKLARALLETRLNEATTNSELQQTLPIAKGYLETIEKLVHSCDKIEKQTGELLTREALLKHAQSIIQIISNELSTAPNRDELVDRITKKILAALEEGHG